MALKLGSVVQPLVVFLNTDEDFARGMSGQLDGAPYEWPAGTAISLIFKDSAGAIVATWPATVVDDLISWDVDKVAVNALIVLEPETAMIKYVSGARDLVWFKGAVVVNA